MPKWVLSISGEAAVRLDHANQGATASEVAIRDQVEWNFETFRQRIYAYLVALGSISADAEDLTQECFIRFYWELSNNVEIINPRAWLFRTARNLYLNLAVSRKAKGEVPEVWGSALVASTPSQEPDPETSAIQSERRARLSRAMAGLTSLQLQYLHLRTHGLRYREIAEIYGVAVPTVQDVIRRAVERLGKEIQ
jgi:RNA polymerase sigma-70 factor (ECF subfamily)